MILLQRRQPMIETNRPTKIKAIVLRPKNKKQRTTTLPLQAKWNLENKKWEKNKGEGTVGLPPTQKPKVIGRRLRVWDLFSVHHYSSSLNTFHLLTKLCTLSSLFCCINQHTKTNSQIKHKLRTLPSDKNHATLPIFLRITTTIVSRKAWSCR